MVETGRVDLDASLDMLLVTRRPRSCAEGVRHRIDHPPPSDDPHERHLRFRGPAYDPSIEDGFDAAIAADPTHRWTREEQLHFAIEHGEPYGPPGAVYCYSDTNANLVGELLEREPGNAMGAAIRELVGYDRLGMHLTYQESIEPEPADLPPWSHQYERDVDVLTIDPSVDLFGGGGLVSTVRTSRGSSGRYCAARLRRSRDARHDDDALAGRARLRPAATGDDPDDAAMFLFRASAGDHEWWGHDGGGAPPPNLPRARPTVVAGHQQPYMPKDFDRMAVLADVLELHAAD